MNRELSVLKNDVGCGSPNVGGAGVLHLAPPGSPTGAGSRSSPGERGLPVGEKRSFSRRARWDDVQTRVSFLQLLEREKRRADRSKAPLSLALFRLERSSDRPDDLDQLIDHLCAGKRDTDLIGLVGDELVAVLLIDTNEQGSKRFIEKIRDRAEGLHFSAGIESYPNQLFESLGGAISRSDSLDSAISSTASRASIVGRIVKRAMDLLGATTGMLLLSPLMLLVAIVIASGSPGPVIYKQTRLGRGGRPFVFYKFRSMYCNADESVHQQYVTRLIAESKNLREGSIGRTPWRKLQSDSRITPFGHFLRKTCIDELPQLFNVLRGDLSLVGPRPPLPYEAAAYESWHLRRMLEVTPGVTGLWQVEGRNLASFDEMVRMDLRYVRTWSIMSDLKILLKTVAIVIRRNGESRVAA